MDAAIELALDTKTEIHRVSMPALLFSGESQSTWRDLTESLKGYTVTLGVISDEGNWDADAQFLGIEYDENDRAVVRYRLWPDNHPKPLSAVLSVPVDDVSSIYVL
jgi:hypothetical protein